MGFFDNFLVNITKLLFDLIKEPEDKDLSLFQDVRKVIMKHQDSGPILEHPNPSSHLQTQTSHANMTSPAIDLSTTSSSVMSVSILPAPEPTRKKFNEVSQSILNMLPPISYFNNINHTIIPIVNEYNDEGSFHSVNDFDDGCSFHSESILSNISVTQPNNSTSMSENHNYIKELPVDYNLKGTIYLQKSSMLNSSSPPALCWDLCTTNSYRTKKLH